MKRLKWFMMLGLFLAVGISACKKEEEKKQGCTNPSSTNYDATAQEDNGSCKMPGDAFAGEWNVKQSRNGTIRNFTATLTKLTDSTVKVDTFYVEGNMYNQKLLMDWRKKWAGMRGTTVSGTIASLDSFKLDFLVGTSTGVDDVKQTYTRK